MSEWLTLKLDAHAGDGAVAERAEWMTVDASGQALTVPAIGTLESLAPLAAQRRVALVVPASDVLTLSTELPGKAGARLLQAVPFAIEEQLADDVESLQFAIGARGADSKTPVSVVSRALLQQWLEALRTAGITPDAVFSDASLLPSNPGQLVPMLDESTFSLRQPGGQITSIPADSLDEALDIVLAALASSGEAGDASAGTMALLLYTTAPAWSSHGAAIEAWRARLGALRVQLLTQGALPLLSPAVVHGSAINLLQGEFAPRRRGVGEWHRWRWAAGLAAALVLLNIGSNLWQLSRLRAEEQRVQAAFNDVVNATFGPGTSADPRAARTRLEQQLQAIRSGAGSGGNLLPALGVFSQALAAVPGAQVQSLSFQNGALEMRVSAASASSLESINASLRAAGWEAQLQGGTATAAAYEGRIRILPAGTQS